MPSEECPLLHPTKLLLSFSVVFSALHCPPSALSSPKTPLFPNKPPKLCIVGYNTKTVAPGSTTGFAVQFEKVTGGNIAIKELVSSSNAKGGSSIGAAADQIWTFDGYEWTKYFFYSARGVTKWLKTPVVGKAADAAETTDTIANGASFFFVRSTSGSASDTITLSGAVVPLTSIPQISVAPGSITAMAYPWPEGFLIKDFNTFNANPKGGSSIGAAADQIWTFDGYEWTKYFFYSARGVTKWLKTPIVGKAADAAETEDGIEAGQAFFFIRSTSGTASDKILFTHN